MEVLLKGKWVGTEMGFKEFEDKVENFVSKASEELHWIGEPKNVDWSVVECSEGFGFFSRFVNYVEQKKSKFKKSFYSIKKMPNWIELAFSFDTGEGALWGNVTLVTKDHFRGTLYHVDEAYRNDGTPYFIKGEFKMQFLPNVEPTKYITLVVRDFIEGLDFEHKDFWHPLTVNYKAQFLETEITNYYGVERYWYENKREYTIRVVKEAFRGNFAAFLSENPEYKKNLFWNLKMGYKKAIRAGGIEHFNVYQHIYSPYSVVLLELFGTNEAIAKMAFEVGKGYEEISKLRETANELEMEMVQKMLKAVD